MLDWLAVEFRESGWDVKHMVRLIVTSATYAQASAVRPDLAARDPANRLLARQNPRRLEAEFVRDNALAIAGLLNLDDIGGPSVFPYSAARLLREPPFPGPRLPVQTDDRQYRRGVYMHWQRTFLHPMLANFDAPCREECLADRIVSNTPQQALTLLNDPTFARSGARLRPADAGRPAQTDRSRHAPRPSFPARASRGRPRPDERVSLIIVSMRELLAQNVEPTNAWTQVCARRAEPSRDDHAGMTRETAVAARSCR